MEHSSDRPPSGGEEAPAFTFPGASRWMSLIAALGAAAAVVLVVVALVTTPSRAERLAAVLAAEDREVVTIEEGTVRATITIAPSLDAAEVWLEGLAPLGAGETYQLWAAGADGTRTVALFRPESDGTVRLLVDETPPSGSLRLTVEPAGGSERPTGPTVMTAQLP